MNKIFLFILFFTFVFANKASAVVSTTENEIYVAVGEGLLPTSFRYRSSEIEGGVLARSFLGAAKMFKNPYYPSLYTEFGAGILMTDPLSAGFYASSGGEWKILGWLHLRCELNATGSLNSNVKGGALVGLSIVF